MPNTQLFAIRLEDPLATQLIISSKDFSMSGGVPPIRQTLNISDYRGTLGRDHLIRNREEETTDVGPRVIGLAEHKLRALPAISDPTPPQRPAIEQAARLADRGLYPAPAQLRLVTDADAASATRGSGLLSGRMVIDGPKTPFAERFGRTQKSPEPTPPAANTGDIRQFDKNELRGVIRKLQLGTTDYDTLDDAIMRVVRICDTGLRVPRSDFENAEITNPTHIKDLLEVFLSLDWSAILAQNTDAKNQRSLRSMFNSAVKFSLLLSPTSFPIQNQNHLALLDDKTLDLVVLAPWQFLFSEPKKTVMIMRLMRGQISTDETMSLLHFRQNFNTLMQQVVQLKNTGRRLSAETARYVEWFTTNKGDVAAQVLNLERRIQALNRR